MRWNQKIRAGALQFVLFIGVVIALLLLTFVTLAHTHSLYGKKSERLVETIKMANLGLDLALEQTMKLNDTLDIVFPFENQIKLKAIKTYWGIFEKYTLVATDKKNRFVKSVLVAHRTLKQLPALYLQDNERPMIIVGKATIKGDAFLPEQGIRPGNISGHSFYGNSLIQGRRLTSSEKMPELGQVLRQQIVETTQQDFLPNDGVELPFAPRLVVEHSFETNTKVLYGDVVRLSEISLTGNIIVKASQRIIVDASSRLRDVVLVAPEIIIQDEVIGTIQALASKRIEVGKHCQLDYPSSLVVNQAIPHKGNALDVAQPEIVLGSNSIVKGVVLYLVPPSGQQVFHPQIRIEADAEVWGEVYCEKNLELKGRVLGSVNTHGLIALDHGSIYQNHLFNGKINSTLLPPQYAGLCIAKRGQVKAIVKWLY